MIVIDDTLATSNNFDPFIGSKWVAGETREPLRQIADS